LGSWEKLTGVSDLVCFLKCSGSYSKSLEALISLLAQVVGELWPNKDWLSHLVDFLFTSRIKFSGQHFGLKFGEML